MKKFVTSLFFITLILILPATSFSDEKPGRPAPSEPPPALDPPEIEKSEPEKLELGQLPVDDLTKPKKEGEVRNREYLPYKYVDPIYPRKAVKKNINGMVIVQYDVTKEGTVTNLRILEEDPLDFGFGKAALKAAKSYQYRPRIIDGEAVEVKGVKTKITFQIGN